MKEPVLILSDLHLGHKVSRLTDVSALRPLIAGAGTVIFNGDTWQELARDYRVQSSSLLDQLRWLCTEEEADAIFLPGNHDPSWPGEGWISLAGGKIIITHGDGLLYSGSPWKREILTSPGRVRELWDLHPAAGEEPGARLRVAREIARALPSRKIPGGRRIWQRAWDAIVPPQRGLEMLLAWLHQGKNGAAFLETYFPAAEFLIIGHFHRQGCWLENGRRIINTGSFVSPGSAHFIELKNGLLTRGIIHETPTACTKGDTLGVWSV